MDKENKLTKELFSFIIKSKGSDTLTSPNDLYTSRKIALEEADKFNKLNFPNMIGNYYLTKEYICHI